MGETTSDSAVLADVTLAMIAGGMGTRMGKPKAWLQIGEQPILAWMLDRLKWPGPMMLVAAPAVLPPPARDRFDQYVNDPVDGLGPLRGVLTALEHSTTPTVVTIAVDMPLLEQSHLLWLAAQLLRKPECLGVMSRVDDGGESYIEPFPAAYRTSAAPILSGRLENEQRSVHRLCEDGRFAAMTVPASWPEAVWTNLNNPAQFAAFENDVIQPLREISK